MPRYTTDRHAPDTRGRHWHPVRQEWLHWCNCAEHCKGEMIQISRATYYRHNPKENRTGRASRDGQRRAESPAAEVPQPEDAGIPLRSSSPIHPLPEPTFIEPVGPAGQQQQRSDPAQAPVNPQVGGPEPVPVAAPGNPHGVPAQGAAQQQGLGSQDGNGSQGGGQQEGQGDQEEEDDMPTATLENLKESLQFIQDIRDALISDDIFPKDLQAAVLEPIEEIFNLDDDDVKLSLTAYLSISNASEEVYRKIQKMVKERYPDSQMLSFEQIKKKVQEFSRVTPIVSHMCVNSCVAFTSKYKDLHACPRCGQLRYRTKGKNTKIPRRKFYTLPIGAVIQSMYRNPTTARYMAYRRTKTMENLNRFVNPVTGEIYVTEFDDYTSGEDYLRCTLSGIIGLDDCVLMISMDGAQLYRQKQSDCWIYIWVLMDLPPELRYKKEFIIPGAVIPGPNAPKVPDSFLYLVSKSGMPLFLARSRQSQ
ncbi:hypothetical protein DFP72DRAFT_1102920 [Ephemerocybe angulata]|uniref:Uncharacterized protein n=1 Tax=Ephemerocybe angulata TaxID=980116 RepID=A0A8H6HAK0_9AGAR|nr:hypothetical protein DFP72DRAFT_1102920 [Tulosesus angulatus]